MHYFKQARPIWPKGMSLEKNFQAGWRVSFTNYSQEAVVLAITGATVFRVRLDGCFLHHGPARGPKEHFRVDVLDLTKRLKPGQHFIEIEVVGYNCNSYAHMNQPSFLQSELFVSGLVVAATGVSGFAGIPLKHRIQRVERFGYQRPYVEAYRDVQFHFSPSEQVGDKKLLPRHVPFPDYALKEPLFQLSEGSIDLNESAVDRSGFWWMNDERYHQLKSFHPDDFEIDLLKLYQSMSESTIPHNRHRFEMWDFGINLTGFLRCKVNVIEEIRLMVLFDEVLIDGDIDLKRNDCLSMLYYELKTGRQVLESIEPYTGRYFKVIILDGQAEIDELNIREFAHPNAQVSDFLCSDEGLKRLYRAGRETFRQNAVDIYMDCPGRERAGWLCDSFFTARAEYCLFGTSTIERNFIENFIIPDEFDHLPKGMLPMCYPADFADGQFIPQWSLWLVLELEEYFNRSDDLDLVVHARPRIEALFEFFQSYENRDGLLEKLPAWNFIEWSKANDFVMDINYPTNMLYAKALEVAGKCYRVSDWLEKSRSLQGLIRDQSYNGSFFVDNRVYNDCGEAVSSGESSEVCQYFAFFFGIASRDQYPQLWEYLVEEMAPQVKHRSHLHPANAFIGSLLRMELLSGAGLVKQLVDEMKSFYAPMAEKTGTLWEHLDLRASCNHGFASYICVLLDRHQDEIERLSGHANLKKHCS